MDMMLFSEDLFFTEVFSTFVIHNYPEFHLSFFSNYQKAEQFLSVHPELDAVIAAPSFWKQYQGACSGVEIEISSKTVLPAQGERAALNIYQPGADIAGDIRKILVALSDSRLMFYSDRKEKILTFFSTQGGSGKTSLAYMTAVQLAKNGQTAYLNLEEGAYTGQLYEQDQETGMEEILFALKDKRSLASILVSGFQKNRDHVYTLPTVRSLSDFKEIIPEDVETLLRSLIELGDIQYLIVDLSTGFTELNQKVLEMSDLIFMVYSDDLNGRGKEEGFRTDPGLSYREYREKMKYIQNRCSQRREDPFYTASFPYSDSLAQGMPACFVLENNAAFADGCRQLISLFKR